MSELKLAFSPPLINHSKFTISLFGICTTIVLIGILILPSGSLALGTNSLSEVSWTLTAVCLSVLLGVLSAAHLASDASPNLSGIRRLLLFIVLLIAINLSIRVSLPLLTQSSSNLDIFVALPISAFALVATVLLGFNTGILSTLISSLVGVFVIASLPNSEAADVVLIFSTITGGGLSASFVALGAKRINDYLRGGFTIAGVILLSVAFSLPLGKDFEPSQFINIGAAAMINGLLSATIGVGIYNVLSRPFGIITRVELMELAQPGTRLLRQMQEQAPGTYAHATAVADLASRGAAEIGADEQLVRAGGMFHDVGKLFRPDFFIENRDTDQIENPHDALDELQSTRVLHGHVAKGIERAREEKLPEAVIRFIPEHHGTTYPAFFYRRALEKDPNIDQSKFRYPGPAPRSRETALVMIADGCEAAVRASTDRSSDQVLAIVKSIIRDRLEDGQFDNCDLTVRDLRTIEKAFTSALVASYHPRIEYPEDVSNTNNLIRDQD